MFDRIPRNQDGFVDNLLQPNVLALSIADVGRKDQPRPAGVNAVAKGLRSEACENDRVNRPDADTVASMSAIASGEVGM